MGKKRSYQWQAVPDEAGATDYKTYPNHPREADADDRRFSRVMEGELEAFQSIPPRVLDPRVRKLIQQRSRRHHGRRRDV